MRCEDGEAEGSGDGSVESGAARLERVRAGAGAAAAVTRHRAVRHYLIHHGIRVYKRLGTDLRMDRAIQTGLGDTMLAKCGLGATDFKTC